MSLEDYGPPPRVDRHRVILPISGIHRGTVAGLRYARALSDDVTAVYVSMDHAAAAAIEAKWGVWGAGTRLVVVDSPVPAADRAAASGTSARSPGAASPTRCMTIVVPQFVPRRQWHNLLHAQTAVLLRLALLFEPGIVITNVPYQVWQDERTE